MTRYMYLGIKLHSVLCYNPMNVNRIVDKVNNARQYMSINIRALYFSVLRVFCQIILCISLAGVFL